MKINTTPSIIPFDPATFTGMPPVGHDIVVYDGTTGDVENGYVLYGFDEIGMFDSEFSSPSYAFVKNLI